MVFILGLGMGEAGLGREIGRVAGFLFLSVSLETKPKVPSYYCLVRSFGYLVQTERDAGSEI